MLLAPAVIFVTAGVLMSPGLAGLRHALTGSSADAQPKEVPGLEVSRPRAARDGLTRPADLPVEAVAAPVEEGDAGFVESPGGNAGPQSATAERPESFDCLIEPWELVQIGSPVTGRIETLPVERGDTVEAGQVVVQLDSSVEKAAVDLAAARAELDAAVQASKAALELDLRRARRSSQLYARQATSLDLREEVETEAKLSGLRLQEARENKRLASLELEQARQVLLRRTITSPVTGVVVDRPMSPGEVVDEEDQILEIAQVDPLRVEVILPSALYGSIQKGSKAALVPELPGEEVYVASVEIVDSVIDAASGTFGVLLRLPNPDQQIPAGLHCQVRFLPDDTPGDGNEEHADPGER